GQDSTGPRGVADQSVFRNRSRHSPGPANKRSADHASPDSAVALMPRHSHLRYVPPAVILPRYRAERRHMEDMRPPFPRWAAWVEMVVRRRTLGTVKAAASASGPDPPAPTSSAVGTCRATRRGRQPSGALDRGGW